MRKLRTVAVASIALVLPLAMPTVVKAATTSVTTEILASGVIVKHLPAAIVGPAAASQCDPGFACFFQNGGAGGSMIEFNAAAVSLANLTAFLCSGCTNGIHGNDGTWNDQMSSWVNNSSVTYCWWVDINRGGAGHLVRPLGQGYIQNLPGNENDTASSVGQATGGCR